MRMPGMDGEALLRLVQSEHPETVRFVLSGQTDRAVAARMVHVAHQVLAKPCDVTVIRERMERALSSQPQAEQLGLRALVNGLGRLELLGAVRQDLTLALEQAQYPLDHAAELVIQDSALSAKVLQIVNSGFFGPPRKLSSVRGAVQTLGVEGLRAALAGEDGVAGPEDAKLQLELQTKANAIAAVAQRVANDVGVDAPRALAAGLFSTLGARVLQHFGPEHLAVRQRASEQDRAVQKVELAWFGTTHTRVAAHLAALWGLDAGLGAALAAQGTQGIALPGVIDLAWVLHVACSLVEAATNAHPRYFAVLAPAAAARSGPQLSDWIAAARVAVQQNAPSALYAERETPTAGLTMP
jgi:HD-like signal output (HDOD) protein